MDELEKKVDKACKVLRTLSRGGRLRIDWNGEAHLVMAEDSRVGLLGTDDKGEEWVLPIMGLTLESFIGMCDKVSDDDLFIAGCENVLRETHMKKRG